MDGFCLHVPFSAWVHTVNGTAILSATAFLEGAVLDLVGPHISMPDGPTLLLVIGPMCPCHACPGDFVIFPKSCSTETKLILDTIRGTPVPLKKKNVLVG